MNARKTATAKSITCPTARIGLQRTGVSPVTLSTMLRRVLCGALESPRCAPGTFCAFTRRAAQGFHPMSGAKVFCMQHNCPFALVQDIICRASKVPCAGWWEDQGTETKRTAHKHGQEGLRQQ